MLYNVCKVGSLTSLSKSTIYRLIKEGKFPKPVRISTRRVGWRQSDVDAHIASLSTSVEAQVEA